MTPTAAGTETTSELISQVLDDMKAAAAAGESGALERLAALSATGVAPPTTTTAPPVVGPAMLVAPNRTYPRPNGQAYHVRKLDGHDDVAVMWKARETKAYPLLTGPPGTGKTALLDCAFYDAVRGLQVFTVQGSGDTEVSDFIGSYTSQPDGTFKWVDGPLLEAMEAGGVLYIDEIALIDPKVLAIVYGPMDGRNEITVHANPERGTVVAQEGFFVVAACNPNAPGARMSEALVSRFPLQFQVTTDWALARRLGVSPKAVTAAQNINSKMESGETSWAPQLRELLAFRDIETAFGESFARRNLVANAPELDRQVVGESIEKAFGKETTELKLQ